MNKTPEELEWERVAKMGAAGARKRMIPFAAGAVAGVLAAVLAFVLMGQMGEKAEADKEARLARGETVIEIRSRGVDPAVGSGMIALLIPSALGFGVFLGVFFVTGGRLSAEHKRGLSDIARR